MKFTFIRHAEPEATGSHHSKWNIKPIYEEAVVEAKSVMPKPCIVYTSPAERAYATARVLYNDSCTIKLIPLLKQREAPLETEKMFEERVRTALITLFQHGKENNYNNLFVVCHSQFINVVDKLFNNVVNKTYNYLDTLTIEYNGDTKDFIYE